MLNIVCYLHRLIEKLSTVGNGWLKDFVNLNDLKTDVSVLPNYKTTLERNIIFRTFLEF